MIAIEKEISNFYQANSDSVEIVIERSDAHLDFLLTFLKPLQALNEKFIKLNDMLGPGIRECSRERLKRDILPKLKDLNKSCLMLIGSFRTSSVYWGVRSALKTYISQTNLLREYIHDIQFIILSEDAELDDLMSEIANRS